MTQEEKSLLLKDLSVRLPYETMFHSDSNGDECLLSIDLEYCKINELYTIEQIKPYLRSMSSMTEEEYKELKEISDYYGFASFEYIYDWEPNYNMTDWLNKHHFDYRGLIPMELALEATEGMYKIV